MSPATYVCGDIRVGRVLKLEMSIRKSVNLVFRVLYIIFCFDYYMSF